MAFERIAEARIREAIREGKLDRLPNAGRPLDLEEYFKTPEDLRMAHSILKAANCVPEEVEILNEIARLERAVAGVPDGGERTALGVRLRDLRVHLAIRLEQRRTRRPTEP